MPTGKFELQIEPRMLGKKLQSDTRKAIAGVNAETSKLQGANIAGSTANQQRRAVPYPKALKTTVEEGLSGQARANARKQSHTTKGLNKVIEQQAQQTAALANTARINAGKNYDTKSPSVAALRNIGQQGLAETLGRDLTSGEKGKFTKSVNRQFQSFAQATPLDDLTKASKSWVKTLNSQILPSTATRAKSVAVTDTSIKAKPTDTEAVNLALQSAAAGAKALAEGLNAQAELIQKNLTPLANAEKALFVSLERKAKALNAQATIIEGANKTLGSAEARLVSALNKASASLGKGILPAQAVKDRVVRSKTPKEGPIPGQLALPVGTAETAERMRAAKAAASREEARARRDAYVPPPVLPAAKAKPIPQGQRIDGAIPLPASREAAAASNAAAAANNKEAGASSNAASEASAAAAALARLAASASSVTGPLALPKVGDTSGPSARGLRQAEILRAREAAAAGSATPSTAPTPLFSKSRSTALADKGLTSLGTEAGAAAAALAKLTAVPPPQRAGVIADQRSLMEAPRSLVAQRAQEAAQRAKRGYEAQAKRARSISEGTRAQAAVDPNAYEMLAGPQSAAAKAEAAMLANAEVVDLNTKAYALATMAVDYSREATEGNAAQLVARSQLGGAAKAAVAGNPETAKLFAEGRNQDLVATAALNAKAKGLLEANPKQQQELLASELQIVTANKREAALMAQQLLASREFLATTEAAATTRMQLSAAEKGELARSSSYIRAKNEEDYNRNLIANQQIRDPQGQLNEALQADTQLRRKRARERAIAPGAGASKFSRFTHSLGYDRAGSGSLGKFFGGGTLATLRYGLPSMALYGGLSGLKNLVTEAEELEYSMARLQGQFTALYGSLDGFDKVRGEIIGIAKATGVQADQVADLRVQLTGAFGKGTELEGLSGESLVSKQTLDASKLAQTVRLPLKEVTDGLTAASLGFNKSFEEIGDVAVKLEEQSGVKAQETISFIGDIAPVAKEAGYSLEEFAAIAAVAQQRSGQSGSALAESFGRVIPALTENKDKLMELAAADKALGTPEFIDAINTSNAKGIFDAIGASYNKMTKENKQLVIQLLGGRREAQKIIPAIANRDLVKSYTAAAEDSEGSLNKRFEDIKNTLSNLRQRFAEAFKEFGIEILDSGLLDMFTQSIEGAKALLGPLAEIAKIIGSFNSLLKGIPAQILLIAAAVKLLKKGWTGITTKRVIDDATGRVVRDNGVVRRESRFTGYRGGFFSQSRFAQGYRASRYSTPQSVLSNQQILAAEQGSIAGPVPNSIRPRGFKGIPRAVGAGLKSSVGGLGAAAASPLGISVGLAVAAATYSKISSQVAKDKQHLEDINESIKKTNESMDLTDSDVRAGRIEDLEAKARDAQAKLDGDTWKKIWNGIFGIQSDASEFLAAAALLSTPQEFQEQLADLQGRSSDTEKLSKRVAPKLGRPTGNLRTDLGYAGPLKGTGTKVTGFDRGADGLLEINRRTFGINNTQGLDKKESDYIQQIADLAGYDPTAEKDFAKLNSLIQTYSEAGKDPIGELIKTALGEGKQKGEDAVQAAIDNLQIIFDDLNQDDPDFAKKLKVKQITYPQEEAKSDFETIGKALELNVISRNEYIKRVGENLETQRDLLTKGKTDPSEAQILAVVANEKAFEEAADKDLQHRFDTNAKISSALGTTESDIDAQRVVTLTAALDPKNGLKGSEARLDAALELAHLQGSQELILAQQAGNTGKVGKILREGFDLAPQIRTQITLAQAELNDGFKVVEDNYVEVKNIIKAASDAAKKSVESSPVAPESLDVLKLPEKKGAPKQTAPPVEDTEALAAAKVGKSIAEEVYREAQKSGDPDRIEGASKALAEARKELSTANQKLIDRRSKDLNVASEDALATVNELSVGEATSPEVANAAVAAAESAYEKVRSAAEKAQKRTDEAQKAVDDAKKAKAATNGIKALEAERDKARAESTSAWQEVVDAQGELDRVLVDKLVAKSAKATYTSQQLLAVGRNDSAKTQASKAVSVAEQAQHDAELARGNLEPTAPGFDAAVKRVIAADEARENAEAAELAAIAGSAEEARKIAADARRKRAEARKKGKTVGPEVPRIPVADKAVDILEHQANQAFADRFDTDIQEAKGPQEAAAAKARADAALETSKRRRDDLAARARAERDAAKAAEDRIKAERESASPDDDLIGANKKAADAARKRERDLEAKRKDEQDKLDRLQLAAAQRDAEILSNPPEILQGATLKEGYGKYLDETYSPGGLSDEGKNKLIAGLQFLDTRRHQEGITDEEKDQLDSVAGLYAAMLEQAGVDAETIKSYYAGRKQGPSQSFLKAFASVPSLAAEKAQADADALSNLDKLTEAQDNLFEAQHPGETVAIAQHQAERARQRAQKFRDLGKTETVEGQQALADELNKARAARDAYVDKVVSGLEVFANRQDISGDKLGAARTRAQIAHKKLAAAVGEEVDPAQIAADQADEAVRQQGIAEKSSGYDYLAAQLQSQGKFAEAAQVSVQKANYLASVARGKEAQDSAGQELLSAQESLRQKLIEQQSSSYDYLAAVLEFDGRTVEAAQVGVAKAKFLLSQAVGQQAQQGAQQGLLSARKALEDAQASQRNAQFALFSTAIAKDDPVAQAKIDLVLAEQQMKEARGITAQAEAQKRLIEVQRQLTSSMNEVRYSQYSLRQAELQAMDDDVGAAQVAAALARQQLADAKSAGAGAAEINNLKASVVSSDKAARDAIFNDKLDEYQYLFDMEKITRGQYIKYLTSLQSTLVPGSKQFKDLALQIKRLKDDISGDLQANLPTSLTLPTLYEVRRFNQTPTASTQGASAGIGYQDNRKMDIQITIGQNMSEGQIVDVLGQALGTGTSGFGPRRY